MSNTGNSNQEHSTRKRTAGIGLGNIKKPAVQSNGWLHYQAAQRQHLDAFLNYLKTHPYRTYTIDSYHQMQEHWSIYIVYSSAVDFKFRQHIKQFDANADIEIQSTTSASDSLPIDIVSLPFTTNATGQTMTRKFFLFRVFYIIILVAVIVIIWQFALRHLNPSRYSFF